MTTTHAPAGVPDARETLAALEILRPELVPPVRAALAGARAAVLARLWGALAREPVPGLTGRRRHGVDLEIGFAGAGAHVVLGPGGAAEPFAVPEDGLTLWCDGRAVTEPGELVRSLGWGERFAAELDNSVANLALARGAQPGAPPPWRHPTDAEQSVVDGHPLHPGCRTRWGMTTAHVLAYAPEHRPVVPLALVRVPAARWVSTGAGLPPLLPMHPWQLAHLRERYPWVRSGGEVVPARPLMSLRTLAPLADPAHHLKTALDVQMTSAVRTVSPAALHNGPAISALLRRIGAVPVMAETAAGAVLVDGEPCRGLAVVVREAAPPGAVPLAAVTTGADPVAFAGELASALLTPLLALLRLGVALEAHGQNVLVVPAGGRITTLAYRDMGGVRISPARLRAHGIEPPPLRGDIPTDDPEVLRTKLYASAMVALAERVAALARAHGVEPAALWGGVARVVRELPDARGLFAPTLPVKATTAMRLAAHPHDDLWAELPNPLAEHG